MENSQITYNYELQEFYEDHRRNYELNKELINKIRNDLKINTTYKTPKNWLSKCKEYLSKIETNKKYKDAMQYYTIVNLGGSHLRDANIIKQENDSFIKLRIETVNDTFDCNLDSRDELYEFAKKMEIYIKEVMEGCPETTEEFILFRSQKNEKKYYEFFSTSFMFDVAFDYNQEGSICNNIDVIEVGKGVKCLPMLTVISGGLYEILFISTQNNIEYIIENSDKKEREMFDKDGLCNYKITIENTRHIKITQKEKNN